MEKVLEESEIIPTLSFKEIIREASINAWKLIEHLRAHLIFYKIITGRGLDFDRLREYQPSDEARYIDWNSFARTNKLFVKIFKEERLRDAFFMLDVSNTMIFGTTKYAKNEYSSILLTTLAYTCNMINDRVSLICFSDKIKAFVPPTLGIDAILQIALTLSKKETYGGVKNWNSLYQIFNIAKEDSYIFLISDFINYNEILKEFIMRCSSNFLKIFLIMVRDPLDSELPEGIGYIYLRDPDTGEISLVNVDKIREEYNKKAKKEEEEVEMIARSYGEFIKVYPNEDFLNKLARFFKEREKLEWS
ncbi:MAG: DUF58 domain-containing protein [Candidatus Aenigmatarchaeota archaeon]